MVKIMRKIYVNELSEDKQNEVIEIVINNLNKDDLQVDVNIILTSKIDDLGEHLTSNQIKDLKGLIDGEISQIKEYKKELYDSIVINDDVKFVEVGMWLVDNWNNDDDELFNNDYPFNYSFDEVIVMDIDEVLKVTKLEDIRKWAK